MTNNDPWSVAYVIWVMANTYGTCRTVSVAQPIPAPQPQQEALFQ